MKLPELPPLPATRFVQVAQVTAPHSLYTETVRRPGQWLEVSGEHLGTEARLSHIHHGDGQRGARVGGAGDRVHARERDVPFAVQGACSQLSPAALAC